MLLYAFRELDLGIYIRYSLDGLLFDLWHLTTKSKTLERFITEALFTDDCAPWLIKKTTSKISLTNFPKHPKSLAWWSASGTWKPSPHSVPWQPCITINSTQLKNVDSFKYLGSTISSNGSLNKEITAHIQKASQALGRFCTKVLQHRDICLSIKLKVYNAMALPLHLYTCEIWILYQKHINQLEQFHTCSLWSMMWIHWQDRITNQEILNRDGSISIEAKIIQAEFHWSSHVTHMDEYMIPRQLLYGELASGSHKKVAQRRGTMTTWSPISCGRNSTQSICAFCLRQI